MKKSKIAYVVLSGKELPSLITSNDPMNAGRLPVGTPLRVSSKIYEIPASGRVLSPWAALAMETTDEEMHFVSPRQFLGLGFVSSKMVKVVNQPWQAGIAIIDLIEKNDLVVQVESYVDVQVDDYNEAGSFVTRHMPKFTIVGEPVATAEEVVKKKKNGKTI